MKTFTINSPNIKFILIFTLVFYGLAICFFLAHNAGTKRFITIQNRQVGGVVIIKNLKYKTAYTLNQARIKWVVDNPADYLFLSSDEVQESVAGAVLKLTIAIMLCVFLWKIDFYEPFTPGNFKRLHIMYWVFIIAVVQELIKDVKSSFLVRDNFSSSGYQYKDDTSAYSVCLTIVVFTVIIYMYGQAVKNKAELDLTI